MFDFKFELNNVCKTIFYWQSYFQEKKTYKLLKQSKTEKWKALWLVNIKIAT